MNVLRLRIWRPLRGLLLYLLLCLLLRLMSLLSLILVIILLLGVVLGVQLSVPNEGAWRGLWIKSLVFVRILGVLDRRLVALVLRGRLLLLMVLWLLLLLQTLMLWAVMIYPALGVITPLRAHSSEWGPIILLLLLLLLVGVRGKLLRMPRILHVFGRHLRRIVICLLKERVKIVLVLLV